MSPNAESRDQAHDVVYYVVFLNGIPERPMNPSVVELHGEHLAELDRKGQLVLAGPLVERRGGLIVLRVANTAEARAIAEDDPMVRGGYESYELATWRIANLQNSYRPNLQGARTQ
ncbi:MAG TPA: YciI family protein [Rhizomicrobium sp.]|jgi:uncharacterized protein YciI|nr:YciI family protein [Rhizomicrobium sp.]